VSLVQKSNLIVEAKKFYASNSSCIRIFFFGLFSWNGNWATYVLKVAQVKNLTWEQKVALLNHLLNVSLMKSLLREFLCHSIFAPLFQPCHLLFNITTKVNIYSFFVGISRFEFMSKSILTCCKNSNPKAPNCKLGGVSWRLKNVRSKCNPLPFPWTIAFRIWTSC
jgi:hypothetical protein